MGEYTENFITNLRRAAKIVVAMRDRVRVLQREMLELEKNLADASGRENWPEVAGLSERYAEVRGELAGLENWLSVGSGHDERNKET